MGLVDLHPKIQKMLDKKDVKKLVKALDHKDSYFRLSAAQALVSLGGIDLFFESFRDYYDKAKDTSRVREYLVEALKEIGKADVELLFSAYIRAKNRSQLIIGRF